MSFKHLADFGFPDVYVNICMVRSIAVLYGTIHVHLPASPEAPGHYIICEYNGVKFIDIWSEAARADYMHNAIRKLLTEAVSRAVQIDLLL